MLAGQMTLVAFSEAPAGWLLCDGSTYNTTDYPSLFAAIGNFYGGDGVTTFKVPNTLGRVVVGAGSGDGLTARNLGDNGGAESVTLTTAQLPSHNHTFGFNVSTNTSGNVNAPTATYDVLSGSPTGTQGAASEWSSDSSPSIPLGGADNGGETGSTGSGSVIGTMPPMFVGTWLIATVSG